VLTISAAELDVAWALNVRAAVLTMQEAWPLLQRARAPVVVNVGSTCSHPKFAGPFFLTYPITKAALKAYSNSLRQEIELLHSTARVVHVTAGAFRTGLTADIPGRSAAVLRSHGPPYAGELADAYQVRLQKACALLSPRPAEDFAAAVAALLHPEGGEGQLAREYSLNPSAMESLVPWLPQALLDASVRSDLGGAARAAAAPRG